MTKSPHIPVMLEEVLQAVEPSDGQIYLDATFGAGGYSRALLESSQCKVYAIDRDPSVAETAAKLAEAFPGRFCWLLGNFGDMIELLAEKGVHSVDAIIMDIGVSSMQIDQSERGFSFRNDGPLDMRMSSDGISAADVVNKFDEEELANIIYTYGEERKSRWVARAIVEYRKTTPITRTSQLAEIVRKVVRGGKDGVDPATRTFQALRIHVNDELGELTKALNSADKILAGEGKLVVVTFHSLEDRIVKQFFQSRSGETRGGSRHLPQNWSNNNAVAADLPTFFLPRRKPILPSPAETRINSRSRSAKMRVAVMSSQAG